ncbi:MAG: hypothetical protein ACJ76Z_14985, partial [Thermoleophilaceae bacterium]
MAVTMSGRGGRELLEWPALLAALDALVGREVAIRVVAPDDSERLLVVTRGRLCARSEAKPPSVFWPLALPTDHPHGEEAGIYLQEAAVARAERRPGGVLV